MVEVNPGTFSSASLSEINFYYRYQNPKNAGKGSIIKDDI
jgi:hypothetical protein